MSNTALPPPLPKPTAFPSPTTNASETTESIAHRGFRISARKLPILKAGPIEEMTQRLGITPPEMIFGDNFLQIEHPSSGWKIEFNAFDALDRVDKTGEAMLKVAYSKEWQAGRQHHTSDIKEVVKPFDWSYTTDYRGTTFSPTPELKFEPASTPIPLHLLKLPDPILFYADIPLYEDELADNGTSLYTAKIRVMPARLLLLVRLFLRLDGVIFRIRDTRVYIEFATGEVIREYLAREGSFEDIKDKLKQRREDETAVMRDPNQLLELLPVVEKTLERCIVK